MANTKISALTSGNPAQSADIIPIDRAGANFSITAGSIAALATAPAWSAITNAAGNLTLANGANTTTFNQTANTAWLWANTSVASAITTNASPLIEVAANYWTGAASATDTWTIGSSLAAGTNGVSLLTIAHSGSTSTSSGIVLPAISMAQSGSASQNFLIGSNTICQIAGNTAQAAYFGTTSNTLPLFFGSLNGGARTTNNNVGIIFGNPNVGAITTTGNYAGVTVSGFQTHVKEISTFNPASGSTAFTSHDIVPTINQTGTASGAYTALRVNVIETALLGTGNLLLDLQAGTTGGTSKFAIDNTGKIIVPSTNTGTTVGTAGAASALPATPTGYLTVSINGTNQKIPYYN